MKNVKLNLFMSIAWICLGILGMLQPWPPLIWISFVLAIAGIGLFVCTTMHWLGLIEPKVYKFMHLYKKADIRNNETYIVKKLTKKEITQLRKSQEGQTLKEIFCWSPVFEEIHQTIKIDGWAHCKVHGYVIASNEDEALKNLHYHQFSDPDDEDNTPSFFSI